MEENRGIVSRIASVHVITSIIITFVVRSEMQQKICFVLGVWDRGYVNRTSTKPRLYVQNAPLITY